MDSNSLLGVVTALASSQFVLQLLNMAGKAQQRRWDEQDRARAREELREQLRTNHNETLNAVSDVKVQPLAEQDKWDIIRGLATELNVSIVPIVEKAVQNGNDKPGP